MDSVQPAFQARLHGPDFPHIAFKATLNRHATALGGNSVVHRIMQCGNIGHPFGDIRFPVL